MQKIAAKIPSKSQKEVEKYHQKFLKKFISFSDPSIRMLGIKVLFDTQIKPNLEKIRQALDENFDNLTTKHMSFMNLPHDFIKFCCKKLWNEGRSNSSVYQEIYDELDNKYKSTIKKFQERGQHTKLLVQGLPGTITTVLNTIVARLDENSPKAELKDLILDQDGSEDFNISMEMIDSDDSDDSEYEEPKPSTVLKQTQAKAEKVKVTL